ncbi:hypothetical protein MTR_1g096600 [Medicago truncatula]|uniref:Secreted protein n=1 Tax=Medicago truncatula TaxID=3880 RepID=A0A072VQ75_MEDTR|nr:hypothetical protein MTR_1g096600 [Medicago truncatula]
MGSSMLLLELLRILQQVVYVLVQLCGGIGVDPRILDPCFESLLEGKVQRHVLFVASMECRRLIFEEEIVRLK